MRGSLFCQRSRTGDHFRGSLAVADDAAGGFPSFLQIRRISGQPAQAGAAVAHHSRQRLIDLMCNGGSQLTKHGQPVEVGERRLELPQLLALLFGANAVSDVASNLQQKATTAMPNQAGVYFDRE